MNSKLASLALMAALLLSACSGLTAQDDGDAFGLEQVHRLDRLPSFKETTEVASMSSYDRTGGNNDGFGGQYSFVRKEGNGLVLVDLKGPGVVYRIWTPTPTDDMMEFTFDGAEEPQIRVKFREIFLGSHPAFPRPLVGYGAGGFYCYVPLPYRESCKILIRAERIQFYQINHATYPADAPIASWSSTPSEACKRHLDKALKLFAACGTDISSYTAPPGAKVEVIESQNTLKPGEAATVFKTDRPGRIVGIRMSPPAAFEGKGRDIVLRAYWDGDEQPAVLSPAGDFFGYAWGEPSMKSLLIGTAGGANYCYYPMPFAKSARIELLSESREVSVKTEVLFAPVPKAGNEGKFYAIWKRENPTTKGKPFTFIETKGRGHLVGFIQQSQGFESGNTYFFEGDDQTTIDGKLVIHGTGSEDFYNGGWYDVPGRWEDRRSFPLSGCLAYKKALGRTGGYRLLLGDAYAYRESVLQTIEHAPERNELLNDYCAVTYLYSKDRPTCPFELPEAEKRRVVDFREIVFATWWNVPIYAFSFRDTNLTKNGEKLGGEDIRYLSMTAKGNDWFGHHFICFTCELPAAGKYKVTLDVIKGPEQGQVQLFHDEAPIGPVVDTYAEQRKKVAGLYLGTLDLREGPNNILIKIVGRNEKSTGLGLDLRNIGCKRID